MRRDTSRDDSDHHESFQPTDDILEKRRANLSQRIGKARLQLDSLTSLHSSYQTSRENLSQWRSEIHQQIQQAYQTSLNELNQTFEQLDRIRSTFFHLQQDPFSLKEPSFEMKSNLNLLKNAEFSFAVDRVDQLEGQIELLKLSKSSSQRSNDHPTIPCRLLIARDQYTKHWNVYQNAIDRIDGQTPECVLICPFVLLEELIENENEIRILIDQSYLSNIRPHTSRMSKDYDLVQLHLAQESCPQSTERVIKIVGHDSKKIFLCLKEIYSICDQQEKPSTSSLYNPVHYNRSKVHLYGGYPDLSYQHQLSSSNDDQTRKLSSLFSSGTSASTTKFSSISSATSASSNNHFDRVLMPVSIRQTLSISDTQAGALLGPKGERIQHLQRETGAIVTIGESHDEQNERRKRIVHVQGTEQQVNSALQAIRRLLNLSEDDLNEELLRKETNSRVRKNLS